MLNEQPPFGNADDAIYDFYYVVKDGARSNRDDFLYPGEAYLRGYLCLELLAREKRVFGGDGHYYVAIIQRQGVWGV